ncbi:uncharacterized protein [Henckelia pumila]|uniref:uncharacterized protein n=1 Tax=Henckelia pumila TaxID=405737 RepID=UPI003C6E5106
MAENNPPPLVPIRDHFRPVVQDHYSGIARGTINANNFEINPELINMVQQNQFVGASTADPHLYLREFLEITDTVKLNGVTDDIIRLHLFSFSLMDQARSWLQSLSLGSITTWEDMAVKFLAKYFPPAKSTQLKIEISSFRQNDFERLYEAWERYKYLLRRCPNNKFAYWEKIKLFYNGLNAPTRMSMDSAARGTIFAKDPAQAYEMLKKMTINSFQWPTECTGLKKSAGVYVIDPLTSFSDQISALSKQIAAINIAQTHTLDEAQYINTRGYEGYRSNPFPNSYHPDLRNHVNFSYANEKNVFNPPSGFNTNKREGSSSLEDVVSTFVAESVI